MDADLGGRIRDVVGDAIDEERHVVEQLSGGEDAIGVECDAAGDSIQPATRQVVPGVPESLRENSRERTVSLQPRRPGILL